MKKTLPIMLISILSTFVGCNRGNVPKFTADICSNKSLNITPSDRTRLLNTLGSVIVKSKPIQKTWYKFTPKVDSNIAYKENLFMAFSNPIGTGSKVLPTEGSSVLYSEDGLHWSKKEDKLSGVYKKIVVAKDYFYAIGRVVSEASKATIVRSKDGEGWEEVFSIASSNFQDIKYVNGQIIAVGLNGLVATSKDGTSWKKQKLCNYSFYNIVTDGKKLLISGDAGVILSSTDGENWTLLKHDIEALGMRDSIYNNGKYLFSSNDTVLIYDKNFTPLKKDTDMKNIAVYKNLFVSLGSNVMLSDDAKVWTKVAKLKTLNINTTEVNLNNFIVVGSDIIFYGGGR